MCRKDKAYRKKEGTMDAFENSDSKEGFTMKLWRGERLCLLGFDDGLFRPPQNLNMQIEDTPKIPHRTY